MKTSLLLAFGLPSALAATTSRADDPVPHPPMPIAIETIYAPDGFDDNDDAQVVIEGSLPSTCYRVSHAVPAVDPATKTVVLTQYARRFDVPCIPDKIPFFTEVALGELPTGKLTVKARGAASEKLAIKRSLVASPDDFPYAQVDAARVEFDAELGVYAAVISGRLTNRCQLWDEIKVLDQGKVVVIQPILQALGGRGCDSGGETYERRVPLPAELADGRHLLHVRSLNGKAINVLFAKGARNAGE